MDGCVDNFKCHDCFFYPWTFHNLDMFIVVAMTMKSSNFNKAIILTQSVIFF